MIYRCLADCSVNSVTPDAIDSDLAVMRMQWSLKTLQMLHSASGSLDGRAGFHRSHCGQGVETLRYSPVVVGLMPQVALFRLGHPDGNHHCHQQTEIRSTGRREVAEVALEIARIADVAVAYCFDEAVAAAGGAVRAYVGLCAGSSCPIPLGLGSEIEFEGCRKVRGIRWKIDCQIHKEEASENLHRDTTVAISCRGFCF